MAAPVLWFMEEIVELVRSSATLVQATGDSTGGRAHICLGDNAAEQIVDLLQIQEQNVEVIKVVLQEQCQQMRFSSERVGRGWGQHGKSVLPHSPSPPPTHPPTHTQSVDSECKRRNLEHVVLVLSSHFTLGKVRWFSHVVLDPFTHIKMGKIQWLFVSCRGSGFCDLFSLFASFAQPFGVAVDHVCSGQ